MPPKQPYIRGLYRQSQPAIPNCPALLGPIKLNTFSTPTTNENLKQLLDKAIRPNNYQQIEQKNINDIKIQQKLRKQKVFVLQKQYKWRLNLNILVPKVNTMIHFKEAVAIMKLPEEDSWAKSLKFYND
ncbi:Hypothetical_protein [Hexamita inflata]|uniref:Hypothetical_protein n=1 Tax=Hexamita inflata TaxID=28002 RepID=A0AA86Q8T4_9EUKA|nr:Hypothetical protein HINF_LOCUS42289 [Hexamita inflata]